jgi:hypothetical protein
MIDVDYNGRFGNRLFQYFTAVLVAQSNTHAISNPLQTDIDNLKYDYKEKDNKSERIEVNDENFSHYINSADEASNMHIVGYFQKREIIKKFIEKRDELFNDIGEREPIKGTYVHVRLGDILDTPGKYCELEYYEKALESADLSGEFNFISSDSPEHSYVSTLREKYGLRFLIANEEDTILRASRFENKILSFGTFSWWIGFLGSQKNVMCPNVDEYLSWHGDIFPSLNWKTIDSGIQSRKDEQD